MTLASDDTLLTIPNVSEGRDAAVDRGDRRGVRVDRRAAARRPLRPRPPPHGLHARGRGRARSRRRSSRGPARAVARIDLRTERGSHPHVGALDVAPVVHLDAARRGAACAEALVAGDELGREGLPGLPLRRARRRAHAGGAAPRRVRALAERVAAGTRARLRAARVDPRSGAVLVAARPPLIAFNVELAAPATIDDARAIAARDPRGRRRGPAGGAGARPDLARARRRRAGQHERRGPPRGPARRRSSRRSRGMRASRAASSSASPPRRRSTASPTTSPVRKRRTFEEALALTTAAGSTAVPLICSHMAQTKKKRRSKHRGNAAGASRRAAVRDASRRRRRQGHREGARGAGAPRPAHAAADVALGAPTRAAMAAVLFVLLLILLFKPSRCGRSR